MAYYAFATLQDLDSRGIDYIAVGRDVADQLLDDAGLILRQYVTVDEDNAQQQAILCMVSCNMVGRAIESVGSKLNGVNQVDATMGPFQQSFHYADALGGLRLLPSERSVLGIDGGYISTIPAAIGGFYGSNA